MNTFLIVVAGAFLGTGSFFFFRDLGAAVADKVAKVAARRRVIAEERRIVAAFVQRAERIRAERQGGVN